MPHKNTPEPTAQGLFGGENLSSSNGYLCQIRLSRTELQLFRCSSVNYNKCYNLQLNVKQISQLIYDIVCIGID